VDLAAVADILASRVVAKADLLLDSVDPAESVVPVVPLPDTVDRVQAAVERVAVRLHRQAVRPSELPILDGSITARTASTAS
jgi:hypothetical protein